MRNRILIIDDDPDYVAAISALLEAADYEVLTAYNGTDGLKLAISQQPDLVLLDVVMTDRTEGLRVLKEMRTVPALEHTPVVIISSIYTEMPVFQVSPDAGWVPADLFLPKPVDPSRLLAEAARLIAVHKG
ncbi:MAG: response regulator [Deltaproteobacteria bacterium]|nr:response regulator [Deltaproteobacteria bacterium]